ncbi:protein FAR1-RELATED SEQUENCE 5-like [Triticum dicoccoides]|uniref:protein FAR1-RELATED SEQUENCE 5-like n=1 Tax=Triticum dicoccoides TaxID=85692 RepID=UPI001891078D|nr:protein FAR1-RELATED SEQUENCE 5-like [Triticum dicoccoides]
MVPPVSDPSGAFQSRSVPDRRVVGPRLPTTWNYGAVERALREASGRGERCIFEPTEGFVFESAEEAYEFYNMFSWEQGFGIWYGRSRCGKSGRKTRQDIVCACEGRDSSDCSRTARTGCLSRLTLLRADDDSWAVLLTEETIEAFRWCFRVFAHSMGGKKPVTVLTDQCHQMRVAIEQEYPDTRHHWCKWHVLKKAKESLGPVYTKDNAFKAQLHRLLDEIVSVEEFEMRWAELISSYSLTDNEFLQRAYDNREMWAKPYFTETFCAGMTSTQRSESANHVLKTYIAPSSPMHHFVSQYNRLIADRVADEAKESHATKQTLRHLNVGVPLERHAAKIYTRALFSRFDRELYRAGSFVCRRDDEKNGIFSAVLLSRPGYADGGTTEFQVTRSESGETYFCACKMFEHSGMPCRHILAVLVGLVVVQLPSGLVLKRWTREARDGIPIGSDAYVQAHGDSSDKAAMHCFIYASAMELVAIATKSRPAFELAVDYVNRAAMTVVPSTIADQDAHDDAPALEASPDLVDRQRASAPAAAAPDTTGVRVGVSHPTAGFTLEMVPCVAYHRPTPRRTF